MTATKRSRALRKPVGHQSGRTTRRYRADDLFVSRSSLLRRLSQDARLERCVQLVR
jgi:hypothetical protein